MDVSRKKQRSGDLNVFAVDSTAGTPDLVNGSLNMHFQRIGMKFASGAIVVFSPSE